MRKRHLLEKIWLLGPVVIWFSYQPLIKIGQDSTSYYELSVPLIYLLVLALVGLPNVWRSRQELLRQKAIWATGAFVAYSLLSLLWTPNLVRGILTAGIIGLLHIVLLTCLAEAKRLQKLMPLLVKILIVGAVVMSILAFVQSLAGIWLPRSETLLCAGCVADQFGFVRPNVFAIEPQFLGSLLIAPLLLLARLVITKKKYAYVALALVIVAAGLFLTLSRGAIYAFLVALVLLFVVYRKQRGGIIRTGLALIASFGLVLVFQGTTAALNPKIETTFMGAVSASVNQLSLGIIDIPDDKKSTARTTSKNTPAPRRDGYVEESTDIRVNRSQLAIETWTASPLRMIFGVGLAGSGVAVHEAHPGKIGAREITQNQYTEVLLEYGLVGAILFLGLIAGLCYSLRQHKWTWAVVLAYTLQWAFFSGYPNAIHIYLILIVMFTLLRGRQVLAKQS